MSFDPHLRFRRSAAAFAAVTALAAPLRAWTLPLVGEVYAGAGARSFSGLPGQPSARMAPSLEVGVDSIRLLGKWGAGLRAAFRGGQHLSAEVRYLFFSLPGLRLVAGADVGLGGRSGPLDGSFGAFVAGRLVLGFPYLALHAGVYRGAGGGAAIDPALMLHGGVTF